MSVLAKGFADLLGRMGISPDLLEGEMRKVVDGAISEVRDHFNVQGSTLSEITEGISMLKTVVGAISDHLAATSGFVPPAVAATVAAADPAVHAADVALLPAPTEHTVGLAADAADFAPPTVEQTAAVDEPVYNPEIPAV